ncbi:Rpn family recombination-promoting nuclease/putative transposase [Fuchsiella alkaliacetigena]|uniref:Rpn family recombination-promoting nuclease/putative transposase n=1 Tax=Fuchsiella alkaliacetigena TaxID=957042 RepID=UPI00200B9F71|nr:Rpn family recombination-promoting nuclease/putative transposase [Fuchsiella alkaliacetigena]MCK8825654.1 Rpn family recombination-promoting nuclease/putative transposase [Fuchsiella alkaliacetigena]
MTKKDLLDPKVDFVFKKIFGSEKRTNILIAFLNAVFQAKGTEKEIVEVKIDNAEINKDWDEDKLSRLDIKATADNNKKINIEIQLKNQYNMTRRSLYYWSKLYSSQLKKGQEYSTLNKTVAINILNFDYLKGMDKHHNCFLLKEKETNQILTDLEEIHFIELTKLDENRYKTLEDIDNNLLPWLLFLKNPDSEVVKMIEERVKELKEAAETLEVLSQDEEAREIYEARQKAIHDYVSSIEGARKEEREKTRREEREKAEKEKREMVKSLLQHGATVEMIVKSISMSEEEVKEIQENIK